MKLLLAILSLLLISASLSAQVFKCEKDGQIEFQDTACDKKLPHTADKSASWVQLKFADEYGRDESEKAREVAAGELRNALNGSVQSQYNVGGFFLLGYGVDSDVKEGTYWFTRAAEGGHVPAQVALGAIFSGADGTTAPAYEQSLKWFRKAAEQNDPTAEAALGRMYLLGRGVPVDHERAAKYLERAAEHGSPEAKEWLLKFGPTLREAAARASKTTPSRSISGRTYTPQQLNAMVHGGDYPAQGPARIVKNEPMSFAACKLTFQSMRAQIGGSYPVKTIVDTSIMYTAKFWTNDGAITVTCSKPDGKMIGKYSVRPSLRAKSTGHRRKSNV